MLFAAISGGSRRTLSSETPRPAAPAGRDTATAAADSIPDPRSQRVLHAAVAGLPNAGKSTLLNYMVGDKVSTAMTRRVRCGLRGMPVLRAVAGRSVNRRVVTRKTTPESPL